MQLPENDWWQTRDDLLYMQMVDAPALPAAPAPDGELRSNCTSIDTDPLASISSGGSPPVGVSGLVAPATNVYLRERSIVGAGLRGGGAIRKYGEGVLSTAVANQRLEIAIVFPLPNFSAFTIIITSGTFRPKTEAQPHPDR